MNEATRVRGEIIERVDAVVATDAFRAGHLPPICVRTGQPADTWLEAKAKSKVGAQWFLIFVGIVLFVLVRVLTVKRANGFVPINQAACDELAADRVQFRDERRRRTRSATWKLALAGLVAGLVFGTVAMVVFGSGTSLASASSDQRSFDTVAKRVPTTVRSFGRTERYSFDAHGCIVIARPTRTFTVCRPGVGSTGVSGFDWKPSLTLASVVDTVGFRNGVYIMDGEPYLGGSREITVTRWNLGMPIGWGLLAGFLIGLGGLLWSTSDSRIPTALPEMYLDRSGERLTLRWVHPAFAAAAAYRPPPLPGRPPPMPGSPPPPVGAPSPAPPGMGEEWWTTGSN